MNAGLLFVLCYRRRAGKFPIFTALIAMNVVRTIILYFVLHYLSKITYFRVYWSLLVLDTGLQLAVVYEIARKVFRPLNVWAEDLRSSFVYVLCLSLGIALSLTWLASPVARNWMQAFTTRGNLFAAILLSELFVAMMAFSIHAGIPWRTHVAKIAQGFGTYSLITVLIEGGHTYFGADRESPPFVILSHVRMGAYLGCVAYWIGNLWRDEQPVFRMTAEVREKLFTLQTRVEYYLRDLQSRQK